MPNYKCLFHNPQSVNFYENCRFVSRNVINEVVNLILQQFQGIKRHTNTNSIIDAGVGNGRLFIPLLKKVQEDDYDSLKICGLDISEPMINSLKINIQKNNLDIQKNVILKKWDLQEEYPKIYNNAEVVYTLATFHILQNWEAALKNVYSTLSKNGIFIYIKEINQFMHQSEGFGCDSEIESMDQVLKKFMLYYHHLRNKYEVPYIPSGIMYSNISRMTEKLIEIGFSNFKQITSKQLTWQKPHKYNDILYSLENRLITTWGSDIPDKERKGIAEELKKWLLKENISLTDTFNIPARVELFIFQK